MLWKLVGNRQQKRTVDFSELGRHRPVSSKPGATQTNKPPKQYTKTPCWTITRSLVDFFDKNPSCDKKNCPSLTVAKLLTVNGSCSQTELLTFVFAESSLCQADAHLLTVATLTGHVSLAVGNGYTVVMDNGPARRAGVSQLLQKAGDQMAEPVEVRIFLTCSGITAENCMFYKILYHVSKIQITYDKPQ